MDIRKIQHAVVLAEKRNYARAAEVLGITQSALSRSIQTLEKDLGLRLFDRSRGGVSPTRGGKKLIADGLALLKQMRLLEHNMELFANEDTGEVKFGIVPMPASIVLPELLTKVAAENRGLKVFTRIAGAQQLLSALNNESIDFAILPRQQIDAGQSVSLKPVGWLDLAALVRAGHPLAGQAITEAMLSDWPVIGVSSLEDPDLTGRARAAPTITCDSQEVLRTMTLNSDAIWLTADGAAQRELTPLHGLQFARRTQFVAASLSGKTLSPAALKLIAATSSIMAAGSQWRRDD